ncbi:hypothetical protein GPROT1_00211 [Gammaproteobacteria bacterium]|jgi:acetolactate synthase regulatory subunit|nr:hypothetical protein GPROT1_00211 [Gammaproteobacteria bacterium]
MRITFQCDDAVSGLSRVLDQIRRLGLDVKELSATSVPGSAAISVDLPGVAVAVGRTLCDRIAQIGGVRGLDAELGEAAAPAKHEAASTGANGHG